MTAPLLAGVVVHWRNESELAALCAAWPPDPRFELVVVDNGSSGAFPELPPAGRRLTPVENLGFAGGVNAGVAATTAELILILNPDARPLPGALEALLAGFAAHPEAAGLAPRLRGPDGGLQHRWQLRPLPSLGRLLLQAFFVPGASGPRVEPAAGTAVEQPAAAALALRRRVLVEIGGMDAAFYPAWFEDVDLARRLRDRGARLIYWPSAELVHGLGASLPRLGYGRFLWIYNRNLVRYLHRHHGRLAAAVAGPLIATGALLRIALLPLRRPKQASTRAEAARALVATAAGALSGWRRPASYAAEVRGPRS